MQTIEKKNKSRDNESYFKEGEFKASRSLRNRSVQVVLEDFEDEGNEEDAL